MTDPGFRAAKLTYRVRRSPRDAAYIAATEQYPDITHSDEWSSSAAIAGLKDKIRATLAPSPPASAPDRDTALPT